MTLHHFERCDKPRPKFDCSHDRVDSYSKKSLTIIALSLYQETTIFKLNVETITDIDVSLYFVH